MNEWEPETERQGASGGPGRGGRRREEQKRDTPCFMGVPFPPSVPASGGCSAMLLLPSSHYCRSSVRRF